MKHALLRRVLIGGLLAVAVLSITSTADACWRCRGWYGAPVLGWTGYNYGYYAGWGGGWGVDCCDYGCYRPSYVPVYSCCTPSYTSCYRGCGLLSRWAYRCRTHHYGYYWGSCSDPCWRVSTCCSTCGLVDCGCGVVEGNVLYGEPTVVPATPATPANEPTPAEPQGDAAPANEPLPEQQTRLPLNGALLTVSVPTDARVLVNGTPTRSTGDLRRYVSRNLNPGFTYTYEVTAEAVIDGQPVTQTKTVHLQAGAEAQLAFDMQTATPVETALTLHVPSDARVYLAGNETTGQGPIRTFRTTKLSGGKEWSEYLVRVTVVRDGQDLTKEELITLRPGDHTELTFDFDVDKVADLR